MSSKMSSNTFLRPVSAVDAHNVAHVRQAVDDMAQAGASAYCGGCLSGMAGLALFIIGCVGAAGAFPSPTIGWVTVGLAGGSLLGTLPQCNLALRKWAMIVTGLTAAALVAVGIIGGLGILSGVQVGWGVVGTYLASIPFACAAGCKDASGPLQDLLKQLNSQGT